MVAFVIIFLGGSSCCSFCGFCWMARRGTNGVPKDPLWGPFV